MYPNAKSKKRPRDKPITQKREARSDQTKKAKVITTMKQKRKVDKLYDNELSVSTFYNMSGISSIPSFSFFNSKEQSHVEQNYVFLQEEKHISENKTKLKRYVDIIEYTKLGMIDEVKELIKQNKNVNERDVNGDCAAVCAAKRNDVEILKVLIDAEAKLNVRGGNGVSPLDYANKHNNQDMIDLIKDKIQPGTDDDINTSSPTAK